MAEDPGCYFVRITYGESAHPAAAVVASTGEGCWWGLCVMSDPTITKIDRSVPEEGNSIDWTFSYDVTTNKYCNQLSV